MASQEKYTILYGRLSQEDMQKKSGAEDDSNSIQNQRLLLEKYAREKGFPNARFIYDDGYSGTNFQRPGWEQVVGLIESGQVATLIVKDMSRLGREYLQVGQYTEIVFPSYGVRFIAVNDGVDSLCESTNDFTPFRNIINEFYAKDCSKKGRSAARVKAETGARVGTIPPFGYQKDPADPKRRIIPDPDAASVVKHIFALCASSSGPAQIAKQLEREKIPTPAYYYYTKHGAALHALNLDEPYKWHSKLVSYILENEAYLGHTVNLRYTTISFKNKRRVMRPESEQLRFEHTHDALIDETTWNIVQEIRAHKRRRTNMDEQDMFSGLVYCMDCGSTMTLSRTRTMSESQYNFTCQNYRKNGKDVCSPHYIREKLLAAIVLDDIRRITHFARQNEVRFAQHIGMKRTSEAQKEINALQKRIDAGARREAELTTLFKRLYEDSALGRIPDEQYRILSNEYTSQIILGYKSPCPLPGKGVLSVTACMPLCGPPDDCQDNPRPLPRPRLCQSRVTRVRQFQDTAQCGGCSFGGGTAQQVSPAIYGRVNNMVPLATRIGGRKEKQDKGVASCVTPPVHTVPQCGPGKRLQRLLPEYQHDFRNFVPFVNGVIFQGHCLL